MTAPFRSGALRAVAVRVGTEPVYSVLVSMAHLTAEPSAGWGSVDGWIAQTAAALTDSERRLNRLVFEGLGEALLAVEHGVEFPEYLSALESANPAELRERALARIAGSGAGAGALLASEESFLAQVRERYPADQLDEELEREAFRLLASPAELRELLAGHLRSLWERFFAAEWKRRQHLLGALVVALQSRSFPVASAPDTIRAVAGSDLPAALATQLADIREIVFVPSAHVALYASRMGSPDTLWVFLATTTVTGWTLRQAPIKPAELLARVTPLADESRLRILELLAQERELTAGELIGELGLSQSGVSRHIKALGGYVIELRGEGASKRYRLNQSHLEWTLVMLRRFLATPDGQVESATPAELAQVDQGLRARGYAMLHGAIGPRSRITKEVEAPATLRRFMDERGLITGQPTRRRDVDEMLAYLAGKFEAGRTYTEREVNEVIRAQLSPTFDDFVTLRRELYNAGLLDRERDGSRYWLREREG